MRYLIKIAYDGSKYNGFQRLNNFKTVQGEIESCLSKIYQQPIEIKGAGRTDRGVHAFGQMAHFDLDQEVDLNNLKYTLNKYLDENIRIISCQAVNAEFHARHSVKKKKYVYYIYCKRDNPLLNDYAYCYEDNFNIKKMKKVAKKFIGIHDFTNLVSGSRDNYNAVIYKIKIVKDHNMIIISFIGKSFYRYMVRNLVGAIIEVGRGKKELTYIDDLLEKKDIQCFTAPPNGLYLMEVEY